MVSFTYKKFPTETNMDICQTDACSFNVRQKQIWVLIWVLEDGYDFSVQKSGIKIKNRLKIRRFQGDFWQGHKDLKRQEKSARFSIGFKCSEASADLSIFCSFLQ